MSEGVYRRGNHQVPRLQEDDANLIESISLSSRIQGQGKAPKFLLLCLILCFLTWTTIRKFQSPLLISTERLNHQATTQGIVFELFRYYRHPPSYNTTFAIPNRMHQRRRRFVLDEDHLESPSRHLLESATHEICNNDETEKQLCDEKSDESNLVHESWTRKMEKNVPKEASKTEEALLHEESLGQWPLQGGTRETDLDIQAFYVKAPIGYDTELTEYFLHIDTGSGITWIMCKGRGPITAMGPNGLFRPRQGSSLDCRNTELCSEFQDGAPFPCTEERRYRCGFRHTFGDGLVVKGHVVVADASFERNDGSRSQAQIAFGCADKVNDRSTRPSTQLTDGLIGLGPHDASWVHQMNAAGLISSKVVAICFEPDPGRRRRRRDLDRLPAPAGFLSFGNSYESRAADIVWTSNIPVVGSDGKMEPMYTARLMKIMYRTKIIHLKEPKNKRKREDSSPSVVVQGIRMGFDSGSDLTYLTKKVFNDVIEVLNNEAVSKGYQKTKDSNQFVKHEQRMCWANKRQLIPITEFGDLVFVFESLTQGGTPPRMVIKPQHYITSRKSKVHPRTCFNMLKEVEFDYGNIGAELMKGHLFLFNSDRNQIGWYAVKSCKDFK